ncbi:MAG: tetratricopeptide repeat protein [Candidatus Lindowbacteria bacterium]|nr:tetratricopeptide repeat protein [Candidatus Lindowbacteria bacterium]
MGFLSLVFSIWMAIHAGRNSSYYWMFFVIFARPYAAVIYFFVEYRPRMPRFRFISNRVTQKDLDRAQSEIKRLDNATSWTHYAEMLRKKGRHDEAYEAAQNAYERDKEDTAAIYELAQAEMNLDKFADAIRHLSELLKIDRQYDQRNALGLLGRVYSWNDQKAKAETIFQELADETSRGEFLYELANIQLDLGEKENAVGNFEKIIADFEYVPAHMKRNFKQWVKAAKKRLKELEA